MSDKPNTPPKLVVQPTEEAEEELFIEKPEPFDLEKFKSKTGPAMAGVGTLPSALPCISISQAKDFVRLHPDDAFWSPELCFANVPIKGEKKDTLHLIVEDLALKYLPSARVLRFRLALATKPHDVFFLCRVPSRNLDNEWNATNLQACEQAKHQWVQATSRREEGVDSYKIDHAHDEDAFAAPKWLKQALPELIAVTFAGRSITDPNHPGLRRLRGMKQPIS